jgi:hypothetical protein
MGRAVGRHGPNLILGRAGPKLNVLGLFGLGPGRAGRPECTPILVNGLVGVAFIALNHPYSRWGASARKYTGGRSTARARTVRDPPTVDSDISNEYV